jgi:hypothetical protein
VFATEQLDLRRRLFERHTPGELHELVELDINEIHRSLAATYFGQPTCRTGCKSSGRHK